MIKRLLIISSDITGHGHKSITESLMEVLSAEHPEITVKVIDGFLIGGKLTEKVAKLYGKVTRVSKEAWKVFYEMTNISPDVVTEMTYRRIKAPFLDLLEDFKPELIISVHPNFNASICMILRRYGYNIPFVAVIADLISISSLWANTKADMTICPSEEAKQRCINYGVKPSKLVVTGFPVRKRFFENVGTDLDNRIYDPSKPLKCLIMSGGEGVGNMDRIASIVLDNFNSEVSIITGRNEALREHLENSLKPAYGDRAKIYGYVTNINTIMAESDLALLRGSPNVCMEAVSCALPLIVTGALPGQEEENPDYLKKYNLAVVCKRTLKLKQTIEELLANDGAKLKSIKESQKKFRNPQTAKEIVDIALKLRKKKPSEMTLLQRSRRKNRMLRFKLKIRSRLD